MSYEEFITNLQAAGIEIPDDGKLSCYWVTGGDEGGDCYGNKCGPISAEPEPEFTALDNVLAVVSPAITFIQYKLLLRNVERRQYTQRDGYYGRFEDRTEKFILLRELHAWLVENKLI